MLSTKFSVVVSLALASAVLAEVPVYGQCGGASWTGETACASGSTCVAQNEFYSQCVPGTGGATSSTKTSSSATRTTSSATRTTTSAPSATVAPPAGITTALPASAGYTAFPTASVISGSFDGHMVKFDRAGSSGDCQEQKETGEADAVFIVYVTVRHERCSARRVEVSRTVTSEACYLTLTTIAPFHLFSLSTSCAMMSSLSRILRNASRRPHFPVPRPIPARHLPRRTFTSNFHPRNQYVRFGDSDPNPKSSRDRQYDTIIKVGVVGLGLCTAYYVAHLERVPETGRWRFIDVGPELEAQIGLASSASLHSEYRDKIFPANHPLTLHVQAIVQRILTSSNLGVVKTPVQPIFLRSSSQSPSSEDLWGVDDDAFGRLDASSSQDQDRVTQKDWEVVVINDPKVVNAAASPGIVFVFTGMLPITQDDAGLAAVLSHEIGHVVARHVPERISSQKVLFVIASLLEIVGLEGGISRLLTQFLLDLPNSRTQEREGDSVLLEILTNAKIVFIIAADVIGLRLMAKACYDPSASPRVFSRLSELESKSRRVNLEFLQTHPLTEKRVKYLEALLPGAQAIVAANPDCSLMQERMEAFRSAPAFRLVQDAIHS